MVEHVLRKYQTEIQSPIIINKKMLDVSPHACNPNTLEADVR